MNNANISSSNTKNKNIENPIENATHINKINSAKGILFFIVFIQKLFGIFK